MELIYLIVSQNHIKRQEHSAPVKSFILLKYLSKAAAIWATSHAFSDDFEGLDLLHLHVSHPLSFNCLI